MSDTKNDTIPSIQSSQLDAVTLCLQSHSFQAASRYQSSGCTDENGLEVSSQPLRPSRAQLEKELHVAAEIGQALLTTHRGTLKDNRRLRMKIDELNAKLEHLYQENLRLLASNQELIDSQSELNSNLRASECRIDELSEQVKDGQQFAARLGSYKTQTSVMASQIAYFEDMRVELGEKLQALEDEKKAAQSRMHSAERELGHLRKQYESMELHFASAYNNSDSYPRHTLPATKSSTHSEDLLESEYPFEMSDVSQEVPDLHNTSTSDLSIASEFGTDDSLIPYTPNDSYDFSLSMPILDSIDSSALELFERFQPKSKACIATATIQPCAVNIASVPAPTEKKQTSISLLQSLFK